MADATVFTVGGTVQAGGGVYIPRRADDELLELCRSATFAYVLTPRQMGKSSLMVRTAERLEAGGVRSVIVDLSQIGVEVTAEAWHLGLLTAVEDRLELDTDVFEWWETHQHLGMTQRLTLFFEEVVLREVEAPVVVFVDEIDTTLSIPFTDDFYAAIRYMHNARATTPAFRRLSFVLIGVATPGDLIADPRRTPFNIGRRVDLTDFTFDEARPLADGLGMEPEKAERVLGWILEWTAGHPYLTQRLGRVIAAGKRDGLSEADVAEIVADTFFGEKSEEDNNLQFVRDMLTRRAPDKLVVLETYREVRRGKRPVPDEEQSQIKNHLKLSGVVERRDGTLELRNSIYATVFDLRWIRRHWPVHWLRRVPPAVWGLIASLAIAVLALALFARAQGLLTEQARELAAQAQALAESEKAQAEQARNSLAIQELLTEKAEVALLEAEESALLAEKQRKEAERHRRLAEASAREAQEQRRLAEAARVFAERERERAEAETRRAEAEFRKNTSRRLVIQANARQEQQLDLALLLSVEAVRIDDNEDTRANLSRIVDEYPYLGALLDDGTGADDYFGSPAAFSRDGSLLATLGSRGRVLLWDVATRQRASEQLSDVPGGPIGDFAGLEFSPEGTLAVLQDRGVVLCGVLAPSLPGCSLIEVPDFSSLFALAFDPAGRTLAVAGEDKKGSAILFLDMDSREPLDDRIELPWAYVLSVVFSPDGRLLAAGGGDEPDDLEDPESQGGIVLWDVDSRLPSGQPFTIPQSTVMSLAFNPKIPILAAGQITAAGGDTVGGVARLWDLEKREEIYESLGSRWISSIAFSPDGSNLAAGGSDGPLDFDRELDDVRGEISMYDVERDTPGKSWLTPPRHVLVTQVVFSPDGKLLASVSLNGAVMLWDPWGEPSGTPEERACRIANRNLTPEEWEQLIGPEPAYRETCPNLGQRDSEPVPEVTPVQ